MFARASASEKERGKRANQPEEQREREREEESGVVGFSVPSEKLLPRARSGKVRIASCRASLSRRLCVNFIPGIPRSLFRANLHRNFEVNKDLTDARARSNFSLANCFPEEIETYNALLLFVCFR